MLKKSAVWSKIQIPRLNETAFVPKAWPAQHAISNWRTDSEKNSKRVEPPFPAARATPFECAHSPADSALVSLLERSPQIPSVRNMSQGLPLRVNAVFAARRAVNGSLTEPTHFINQSESLEERRSVERSSPTPVADVSGPLLHGVRNRAATALAGLAHRSRRNRGALQRLFLGATGGARSFGRQPQSGCNQ